MPIHLKRSDPTVNELIRAAFPSFNGQEISADVADRFRLYGTNWDEGSKRDYRIVALDGLRVQTVQEAPFMERSPLHEGDIELPPGYVVVVLVHFRGRQRIEFIANAASLSPMLPPPDPGLTEDERTVLLATKSLKSSYGGESNFRFQEARRRTGITRDRWDGAKESLIGKRLLNKAGAITVDGRNVVGDARF